jgi:polyisoprenoid-binding protein YceI
MTKTSRSITILGLILSCSAGVAAAADPKPEADSNGPRNFQIDAKRSRFIVETETTGLSAMFAHDHRIEVRDFSGQAVFRRDQPKASSLQMTVRAPALFLLGEENIGARQSVETALREDVLQTQKFPEITFKSRAITAERRGDGTYDARITGELKLHGVKRQITIPARIAVDGGTLHAIGVFDLRQTDYGITPFSFSGGSVGIKDTVTLSFDILAAAPRS